MTSAKSSRGALSWLKPIHLLGGVGSIGLLLILLFLLVGSSDDEVDAPPPPTTTKKPSEPAHKEVFGRPLRFDDTFYQARVASDAKKAGVKDFRLQPMKQPFAFYNDFSGKKVLKSKKVLKTEHLLLKAEIKKVAVGEEGQGFRATHILLSITNRTNKYLAYKVDTEAPGKYKNKGFTAHNAIALKPGETITRTESLPPKEESYLTIKSAEVLELPPLGYYYVSRLDPARLQYDLRVISGHTPPPGLPQCRLLPWRTFLELMEQGEGRWEDFIDFYARHDCNEYIYYRSYRWSVGGPARVPTIPPKEDG